MRPRATMQSWPCTLWHRTAPCLSESERETEILLADAQFVLVVWWTSNHPPSLFLRHEHGGTHEIKWPHTSAVNLPLLHNKHRSTALNFTPRIQVMLDNLAPLNPPGLFTCCVPSANIYLLHIFLNSDRDCKMGNAYKVKKGDKRQRRWRKMLWI